ncbi:hypothetical protein LguiB_013385 [Lonicera macranthoides]
MKNKTEQEIALLRQFDQAWNVYGVLNFLQALVEKSNIIQILEQEKGLDNSRFFPFKVTAVAGSPFEETAVAGSPFKCFDYWVLVQKVSKDSVILNLTP